MDIKRRRRSDTRLRRSLSLLCATACVMFPGVTAAQGLTGALIGTVEDAQGGVLPGAAVRVSSPALIGGPATVTTNEKGQLRFAVLPPGAYVLDITMPGFATYHEEDISIGAGATIERMPILKLGSLTESVAVQGTGSRIDARNPGFGTRFGQEDLTAIPTRRTGMSDMLRAAPGISATSPASGTVTTVSAFGSGTNENQFLIDGTNFTAPGTGIARAEPGIDFIQEVHVQSVGASAEFGNVQGAVINVITRQGSERFLFDASYYAQTAGLTSQPVRLLIPGAGQRVSGYERARYRDATTTLGGPVVRDRLWFFAGYQYVRDYDGQPGSDPAFPRTYEQDKIFGRLTWRLAPGWQLDQNFHDEVGINPDRPTLVTPFEATPRVHQFVPAMTLGHLTHTLSPNTVWDVRVGRFAANFDESSSSGNPTTPSRLDRVTGVTSGAPGLIRKIDNTRTSAKWTITHYRSGLWGADHESKVGGQVESGQTQMFNVIPTGVRYEDRSGKPFQAVSSGPSNGGGRFVTAGVFASDALTVGNRLTINAGLRFDHSRVISQDVHALDAERRDTGEIIRGLGTMYTWNVFSPRLGVTEKLSADGRTILRASYGRFNQGAATSELAVHPGTALITMTEFAPATGAYTGTVRVVDPRINLQINPDMRTPHTDQYSIGLDREIGRLGGSIVYVRKDGTNFIGWTDVGGQYREDTRTLADGRTLPVSVLLNGTAARRFLLTNPDGYSLTYNGLVMAVERRRSRGWQAFGSYTLSNVSGLQASNGTTAAGAQVSTVGAPLSLFGRDPNDLTNASGRLPNDRPHMFRAMGSVDVPRTGFVFAGSLQLSSGKPWAATAQVSLPQGDQRILLEPRGSRRLSSQKLLDLRLSRAIAFGGMGRLELLVDMLNVLNDTAEEGLTTDNLFSANFAQPTIFVDPRRAMVSVRLNLGR